MTADASRPRRYARLASALALSFLVLSFYAWRTDAAAGWEVALVRFLQAAHVPGLRDVAALLAVAGHGLPWVFLVSALSLGMLVLGGVRVALLLAMTSTLQDVGSLIKLVVERTRPSAESVDVWREISSYSFPSGHTLGATLVFGFLFFALERTRLPLVVRRAGQVFSLAWIALMGTGRVVLGAHWPTDVLGAYLAGALLLLPIVFVLRRPAAHARLDAVFPAA